MSKSYADTMYSDLDGVPDFKDVEPSLTSGSVPPEYTATMKDGPTSMPENGDIAIIHDRSKKISKKILADSSISVGQVLYKVPDTMVIYSNYRITVRIANDTTKETNSIIPENLHGNLNRAVIPVTSEMEVNLIDESPDDDKAFKITKINDNQQEIIDDYTEWIFNVQPIKAGERKLNLVVSIIRGKSKKQVVYTDTIHVKNSVKKEVSSFWKKYWQYLLSTIIIPLAVYGWKKIRKEKS